MKKITWLICFLLAFSLCACSAENAGKDHAQSANDHANGSLASQEHTAGDPSGTPEENKWSEKTLVVYFSATGNTETVAEYIREITGGTLCEILPETPYTADDLKYYTDCRADREQKDPACRPAIRGHVEEMETYDTLFLGYPIWHGQAPKILYTFLESYDLSGKILIPFCTSASSPVGSSAENLHTCAPDALWMPGVRFGQDPARGEIEAWINGLDLPERKPTEENMIMKIRIGNTILEADFADNSSARAFAEYLRQGPVTVQMSDYGNFEKVGDLPQSFPRNDEPITTVPGDIILYLGRSITIYYDTNSWNFTRLGRIRNVTGAELKNLLGEGNVTVIFSLEESV